jgi:uncharacterized protein YndB with AHSA1/START domain
MTKSKFVYVTYIASTPDNVWQALTDSEITKEYWTRSNVSDWKVGSRWEHQRADGSKVADIVGKVIENDRPRRLVISWASPEGANDPERVSRVTFEIVPQKDIVRLTVTHDELQPGSEMEMGITQGWPKVLSNLKSWLETGKAYEQFLAKP